MMIIKNFQESKTLCFKLKNLFVLVAIFSITISIAAKTNNYLEPLENTTQQEEIDEIKDIAVLENIDVLEKNLSKIKTNIEIDSNTINVIENCLIEIPSEESNSKPNDNNLEEPSKKEIKKLALKLLILQKEIEQIEKSINKNKTKESKIYREALIEITSLSIALLTAIKLRKYRLCSPFTNKTFKLLCCPINKNIPDILAFISKGTLAIGAFAISRKILQKLILE